ncbi:hypothetical protein D9758_000680 [Tetrapyrgos nigripes]|uniref:Gamma-butyrobetaine dioxygenase n=1 Tax=Tetrapyrgos nigripes TaxID=182062 RepID=A0A8H5GZP0_9AGAR|nr:hypothetical protein D9758_000680 [Tetrapyrgos nigripes]
MFTVPRLAFRRSPVLGRNCQPFRRTWSSFSLGDNALTIDAFNNTAFPYVWLRDSCQSPECVHPPTSQKLHQSSDIPLDVKPIIVQLIDESSPDPGLRIEWQDGHISSFQRSFLERYISQHNLAKYHKDLPIELWNEQTIASSPDLFLENEELETPQGMLKAINQLCRYGLVFIRAVPNAMTSFDKCGIRELVYRFGYPRETFYGLFWNVINTNSQNIAYTNLKLDLHMDLMSFESPPRYQILHCVRNRVEGGTSIFVDGFNAATQLRDMKKSAFDILASTLVPFKYIFDGHHLHHERPTIELDPFSPGRIKYINYAPPFQAPLHLSSPPEFYSALKSLDDLLHKPENMYSYQLEAGDAVIFDNRRILHARTAFQERNIRVDEEQPDKGVSRWLQGCYFESETMQSRGRVLRAKQEQGLI